MLLKSIRMLIHVLLVLNCLDEDPDDEDDDDSYFSDDELDVESGPLLPKRGTIMASGSISSSGGGTGSGGSGSNSSSSNNNTNGGNSSNGGGSGSKPSPGFVSRTPASLGADFSRYGRETIHHQQHSHLQPITDDID